ncbi:type II toxin-antitoxin system RelE/ParE family toxin [Mesorhizobium sp. ESP-6-4]|uniref:type II toxin-antitoxin system RelE/ParE family toxin n=1 Tax=Mesorhizobium sp. ESP-6-4 TaxID=2876624 RepID=UPI001CCF50BC|nr:type II toxin-antitoxin system RelE/ParE family toxin [Mesorhizobium sp. ESP-6-4]MBZ9661256.1 type II toxin-antitoxin system RelE/ParE family toxin [Mesorhizobium sp. ESP-6-4]
MKLLVFADQAEGDLEAIGDHIASDNPFRAMTFVRELRNACIELCTMQERCQLAPRHQSSGIVTVGCDFDLALTAPKPCRMVRAQS